MSASGSTNYFRELMGIEETCYRIYLRCDKARHLGKKLLLSGPLDGMLYKLDMQDPQKNDCWTCLKKVRQSFSVPASWKSLPDILQDIEESDWIVFQISCFMEKSVRYFGPMALRWIPQVTKELWVTVQAVRCLCQFSRVLELLTMYFMLT